MNRASRPPLARYRLAVCAALLAGTVLWPSTAPAADVAWAKQFGTSFPDDSNGLTIDAAGDLYVIGQTSGTLTGQQNAGMIDAFVRKYNPAGSELWSRQFGSAERDIPKGITLDAAGNLYVVGETFGSLPGKNSAGGWDAFLRKYTPTGDEVWTTQFGGGGAESGASVRIDPSGNAYVVGGTRAALPGQTNIGDYDGFICKFDTGGNQLWARQFGTPVEDYTLAVTLDNRGYPILAGETGGHFAGASPAGALDGFVRQYDPAGNVVWTRQFGSPSDDYAVNAAVAPNGRDVLVVGTTTGALPGQKSAGDADAFIAAFSGEGGPLWSRQFGTPGVDDAEAISFDAAGKPFVAGRVGGPLHGSAAGGGSDAFLAATGPTGDILWVQQFGGEAEDYALALAIGQHGRFYLAGGTTGALPGQRNIGQRDAFVLNIS